MINEFGETFAQFYCKEKGIKPVFCESLIEYNSSTIKVRYHIEGQEVQCDLIGIKQALDITSKHILGLEKRLSVIEGNFIKYKS